MRYNTTLFGPNVYVIDSTIPNDELHTIGTSLFNDLEKAQFGDQRVALLFQPGTYTTEFKIGFYTQVAGLGRHPNDVQLAHLGVNAQWLGRGNATCNFWRAIENVTLTTPTTWAVSQAAPMRRLHVQGSLQLHDNGYASGGFLADSLIDGIVDSGPQQQWYSRTTQWHGWQGANWNMVFHGVVDQNSDSTLNIATAGTWPTKAYTTIHDVPLIREKPYLTYHEGEYSVVVPSLHEHRVGVSWVTHPQDGVVLPLTQFYIARSDIDRTPEAIQHALDEGRHLLLTPGIYQFDRSVRVTHPNTVVLGLGYATLVATQGNACIEVDAVDGVTLAGLLFDAGETTSPVLVRIGHEGVHAAVHSPILLSDLFFRVGGTPTATPTRAHTCLEIHTDRVIGDHFWIWRADHGTFSKWHENDAEIGLRVTGNDVTIYGLFVEHFQGYNTLWEGERGRVYFYQNEIPYDVPYQKDWMSHQGAKKGYAQYKVADHVRHHSAIALGIYGVFLHNLERLELTSAVEAPSHVGIDIDHIVVMMIVEKGKNPPESGGTIIRYVLNDQGDTSSSSHRLVRYIKKK